MEESYAPGHAIQSKPMDFSSSVTHDESMMARWGKRQQLKRNFSLLSIVGLTTTLMSTWESFINGFNLGLENGGPAGLIYGFLLTWIGVFSQALVIAELGSMIPLAGGQYNWVSVLAPDKYSKYLSYLTGWMSVIGWQAATCDTIYIASTIIQGLLIQNISSYTPQQWHATLIGYAILAFSVFINTYLAASLPKIESVVFLLHLFGFLFVLIPLVYFGPHGDPATVFTHFLNEGHWPNQGLSFFVGLATSTIIFTGLDGATHMAEEIENAAVVIPRSIIASVVVNGTLGFSIALAVLFCLGDQEAALKTPTKYSFIEVFTSAVQSKRGGSAMTAVIIYALIFSIVGFVATSSRMLWAFARERAIPGHSYIARVDQRTKLPIWSILATVVINALLSLIQFGSTVSFDALSSLAIAGFYTSFLMSASVMLLYRLRTPSSNIPWGPFRLGRVGTPVTVFSIAYSLQGIFFSFWPPSSDVTLENMNWSAVVFAGVFVISMIFWIFHGQKIYKGPVMEVVARNRTV